MTVYVTFWLCVERGNSSVVSYRRKLFLKEVKERAISCMGRVIANMGDELQPGQLPECLPLLLDRLKNEITRLTAVKALTRVAQSPLNISLDPILVRYLLQSCF